MRGCAGCFPWRARRRSAGTGVRGGPRVRAAPCPRMPCAEVRSGRRPRRCSVATSSRRIAQAQCMSTCASQARAAGTAMAWVSTDVAAVAWRPSATSRTPGAPCRPRSSKACARSGTSGSQWPATIAVRACVPHGAGLARPHRARWRPTSFLRNGLGPRGCGLRGGRVPPMPWTGPTPRCPDRAVAPQPLVRSVKPDRRLARWRLRRACCRSSGNAAARGWDWPDTRRR